MLTMDNKLLLQFLIYVAADEVSMITANGDILRQLFGQLSEKIKSKMIGNSSLDFTGPAGLLIV